MKGESSKTINLDLLFEQSKNREIDVCKINDISCIIYDIVGSWQKVTFIVLMINDK